MGIKVSRKGSEQLGLSSATCRGCTASFVPGFISGLASSFVLRQPRNLGRSRYAFWDAAFTTSVSTQNFGRPPLASAQLDRWPDDGLCFAHFFPL